jgi:hypothetical protein
MKKMTLAIVGIVLSAVACISCKETATPVGEDFEYVINIDDAETAETPFFPVSKSFDRVTTIIPEMTDRSLLSSIHKIEHVGDRLYVLDGDLWRTPAVASVMEFDLEGRFIRKYGNAGRGPGEYLSLFDFAVNRTGDELFLFDGLAQIPRIRAYDRNSGKYLSETGIDNEDQVSSYNIVSVEDVFYTNLFYNSFDESNYMLRSWNRSDPQEQSYYLNVAEYLKGWTNTSLKSNSRFIYKGDRYSLFNDGFSNEIFKLTADGVGNYIYVDSEYFFGEKERQIISDAYNNYTPGPSNYDKSPVSIMSDLDCWRNISSYFETKKHIGFWMNRGRTYNMFLYDKESGKTIKYDSMNVDLIIKEEYKEELFVFDFMFLQADEGGLFFIVRPEMIARLREAAQEGELVDGLDNLEALKQLPDSANPVIFYMQFKE